MSPLKPRPDCEGPKLEPFTNDITAHDIEFLEVPSCGGAHGIITEVKIDGQIYCLKLFLKPDGEDEQGGCFLDDGPIDTSPTMVKYRLDHVDPFHCECRAFGRLKQLGREDLAVRVYGYISLPLTKDILKNMHRAMERNKTWFGFYEPDNYSNRVTMDPRQLLRVPEAPDDGSWCVMGILKDWVGPVDEIWSRHDTGLALQPSIFRRMLANLKALHRCGIVVCDVKWDQWVDSTLVDLSCALIIPYMHGLEGVSRLPSWTFASIAAWDLWCFQTRVIDCWNEIKWSEWYPNVTPPRRKCRLRVYGVQESCKLPPPADQTETISERLRPRPRQYGPFLPILNPEGIRLDLIELPPYDPAKFDWRAAEASGGKRRKSGPTTPLKTSLSG